MSFDRGFLGQWVVQLAIALCLAGLFALVAWRSVQHVNTLWDEEQDYPIAVALLQDPLRGSHDHGSQARLPMYAAAVAFALAGESVASARLASISAGALAIMVTWVAGRQWFGNAAGLQAAGLLAISPYFIGFSRAGMTEGDAFCPLTVLLALVALDVYLRRRDSRGVLFLSAALGLAAAAKFFALILFPALLLCDLLQRRGKHPSEAQGQRGAYWGGLAWIGAAALLELLAIVAAQGRLASLSVALWAAGAAAMLGAGSWLIARGEVHWPVLAAWPAIALLAFTICVAAFPAHALEPSMIGALLYRSHHWDGASPLGLALEAVRLYSGVIVLKLGISLGLLSVGALMWAGRRFRRDDALRRIVVVVAIYLGLLVALPLLQPFYLMSVYPLLVLVLAAFVKHVTSLLHGRPFRRGVWLSIVIASHAWLVWGAIRVYPEFGWYGYETIGDRWLGAESRGYRNIVQVTNDGTQDALRWLVANVPADARVVSHLGDYHVVDSFVQGHQPVPFRLVQTQGDPDRVPPERVEHPDYLVMSLGNLLRGEGALNRRDDAEMELVHGVWRGSGRYRMPVVSIYKVGTVQDR